MNIVLLEGDQSRQGGTERMAALLSGWLCGEHRVQIISLHQSRPELFFPLDRRVQHRCLPAGGMLAQMWALGRIIRREGIEVVINVDTGMGIYGLAAAAGTRARVITWEHSNFHNNWDSRVFPLLRGIAARHSDALVVLTRRDRQSYQQELRGCAPVWVIPNPAEPAPRAAVEASRMILSAGNFGPVKRFELIPEIGRQLFARHPDWCWVICGDGPGRAQVEEQIRAAGLHRNILLPGAVQDMDAWYRRAALAVLTSAREGLPMVLLEAGARGLPLVSFDIPTGPAEIIREGVNGFLIPEGDVRQMTEKLLLLMEQPALRRRFADNAQAEMKKFSTEKVVRQWKDLLKSL